MTEWFPAAPEHRPPATLTYFNQQLSELIHQMKNISWHSIMPNTTQHFGPEVEELQRLTEELRGQAFQAETWSSLYFFAPLIDEVHQEGRIGPARRHPHVFQGILDGIDEIRVPSLHGSTTPLCLRVFPLYVGGDPTAAAYFSERGWVDKLRHPFGLPDHSDTPLWLEVQQMEPGSVEPLHMPNASG